MEKRLQKIISELGIASRRKAEELIKDGLVTVNGQLAHPGTKADPMTDHIKISGKLITQKHQHKVYLMFYKPAGIVTSLSDPENRHTIMDFLHKIKQRVFPVGRLDFDSEGLLFITNDGDFSHSILHPSKKIPKTYHVKVNGVVEEENLENIRKGIRLEDGWTMPAIVKKLRKLEANSWLEITLFEGRKRQIRRMLQRVGHPVIKLKRVSIGPLKLGQMKPGDLRHLSENELSAIADFIK